VVIKKGGGTQAGPKIFKVVFCLILS